MNKILTVVIPTYNMEKYLRRCLDSLIIDDKELFDYLEVLVINDGSKDSSSAIAHEYQDRYPNVFRVIDKENGNYGSCVNRGLKEASGKFFRILDADDWFDTSALQILLSKLSEIDSDVIFTQHQLCNSDGNNVFFPVSGVPSCEYKIDRFDFIATKNSRLLSMHSITYKTTFVHEVNLRQQEGISYTDIEYCYFPLVKAETFQYIDVCLYNYYIGREGQTVSKEAEIKHFNDFYLVCSRLINDYVELDDISVQRRKMLIETIMHALTNFYFICLVYKKKLGSNDVTKLKEVDNMVQQEAQLLDSMKKSTYHKIPYYMIWKRFGFRLGILLGQY